MEPLQIILLTQGDLYPHRTKDNHPTLEPTRIPGANRLRALFARIRRFRPRHLAGASAVPAE